MCAASVRHALSRLFLRSARIFRASSTLYAQRGRTSSRIAHPVMRSEASWPPGAHSVDPCTVGPLRPFPPLRGRTAAATAGCTDDACASAPVRRARGLCQVHLKCI